jgi:hypothetical protein
MNNRMIANSPTPVDPIVHTPLDLRAGEWVVVQRAPNRHAKTAEIQT